MSETKTGRFMAEQQRLRKDLQQSQARIRVLTSALKEAQVYYDGYWDIYACSTCPAENKESEDIQHDDDCVVQVALTEGEGQIDENEVRLDKVSDPSVDFQP